MTSHHKEGPSVGKVSPAQPFRNEDEQDPAENPNSDSQMVRSVRFVAILNDTARDAELSFRARGVLAYMLSHRDGWRFSVDSIARAGKEGREAVRTAIHELEEAGYLERRQYVQDGMRRVLYVIQDRRPSPPPAGTPPGGRPTAQKPAGVIEDEVQEDHVREDHGKNLLRADDETEQGELLPTKAVAAAPAPKPRKRNELFDAVMAACGLDYAETTKTAMSGYAKRVNELKDVGATPDEVHTRAAVYRRLYPGAALTPHALANQWAKCKPNPGGGANAIASNADRLARLAGIEPERPQRSNAARLAALAESTVDRA